MKQKKNLIQINEGHHATIEIWKTRRSFKIQKVLESIFVAVTINLYVLTRLSLFPMLSRPHRNDVFFLYLFFHDRNIKEKHFENWSSRKIHSFFFFLQIISLIDFSLRIRKINVMIETLTQNNFGCAI